MNTSGTEDLPPGGEEDGTRSQARPASLGRDVATAKFEAALLCEGEGKVAQRTCSMDAGGFAALDQWIRAHGVEQVHACLEATGEWGVWCGLGAGPV